ncbi:hypothetical protein CHUAL_010172 [Chamberlinius hualienensis]
MNEYYSNVKDLSKTKAKKDEETLKRLGLDKVSLYVSQEKLGTAEDQDKMFVRLAGKGVGKTSEDALTSRVTE